MKPDYLTNDASMTQRPDLRKIWLYCSRNPADTMIRYIYYSRRQPGAGRAVPADFADYRALCAKFGIPE